jgi:ribosome-binding protein aMBF1 (putative translation factor)
MMNADSIETLQTDRMTLPAPAPSVDVDGLSRALAIVIHARRRQLGISQEELAVRSQLHRTYISDLERGARNISVRNLCRIAFALELGSAELLGMAESHVRSSR